MNATVRPDFGTSWYAARAASAFERPRLTFDLDVDVCVIGGGLAGLTVAREVARRGWSVAVLEARRVAWSASGRNCGFVLPGFGADVRRMVERVGLDHAKALWRLSEAGVDYVRMAIRDNAMPGVEPVSGWLDVSKVDNGDEMLAIETLLGQEFGAEIEGWPTERVRAVLESDFYFHAIHYPTAFHIDPLNYAIGLANAALAAGAVIFEETPALAINPTGVRKWIRTPSGRVRAPHIVLAANAQLGSLVPTLAETVLPVTGYVAVTAPLGERLRQAIDYKGVVSDSRHANHHYRVVDGDRLMWAGGGGFWGPGLPRAVDRFKAAIARIYPQLGKVEIEHAWSGVTGFSVHGMPQMGEVVPGLWLASAFGAQGLNTTAMAGELIAGAITERDDRWRLFLPYELVWAGGALGRVVRHVGAWTRRLGEDWAGNLARRREAVRRAEAQQDAAVAGLPPEPAEPVPAGQGAVEPAVAEPALPEAALPEAALPEPAAVAPDVAERVAVEPAVTVAASPLVPEVESLLRKAARRSRPAKGSRSKTKQGKKSGSAPDAPAPTAPPSGTSDPEQPGFSGNSRPGD